MDIFWLVGWFTGEAFGHAGSCRGLREGPNHRENAGIGWYPSWLSPARSPLEGDIPNRYPFFSGVYGVDY